ncbi:M15 family metallopeptidase [Paenibacillus arenilitoris]|uniref:M15 family metallopeptidase n=1 Tax=Paenibacillus arenilitoris TaxID=2772299 RepID=A0A927CKV7_9BACL|nr:M15 family metallopeptidase [Paenibacillus arenilitoris]MBD2869409.1 M15 family metallopeptidase [Paenibacillus arenilitoris]
MLQRNHYSQPLPPAGQTQLTTATRSRRNRNRALLLIILALTAYLIWKSVWPFERSVPEEEIVPVHPVSELHPIVAAKQSELIAETAKLGITILITDGFRSVEEQDALYAQGRTAEGDVVTQVQGGNSYHNYGLAIDFALRTKAGEVVWDMQYDGNKNGEADWMEVVDVAKRLGFTWGGDWANFPDYPHLQMDFGYTIRQLKRGMRPPVEAE